MLIGDHGIEFNASNRRAFYSYRAATAISH
jgi:hypothetical protein